MAYMNVEIELCDIDDDDLIEEMQARGLNTIETMSEPDFLEYIHTIWEKRRVGKDYQKELDQLIYRAIGKVI